MDRYGAIRTCRNNGLPITDTVTFASKNAGAPVYWANPRIDVLRCSWWLILNDTIRCVLYVFCIPANTISQQQVRLRNDNQNLMDIEIQYDDPSFKDTRSNIRFKPWLRMKIPYSNLFNGNQRQEETAPQSSVQKEVPEQEQARKGLIDQPCYNTAMHTPRKLLLGVQSCKDLREKVFFLWIKQNTLDFLQGLLYFS